MGRAFGPRPRAFLLLSLASIPIPLLRGCASLGVCRRARIPSDRAVGGVCSAQSGDPPCVEKGEKGQMSGSIPSGWAVGWNGSSQGLMMILVGPGFHAFFLPDFFYGNPLRDELDPRQGPRVHPLQLDGLDGVGCWIHLITWASSCFCWPGSGSSFERGGLWARTVGVIIAVISPPLTGFFVPGCPVSRLGRGDHLLGDHDHIWGLP